MSATYRSSVFAAPEAPPPPTTTNTTASSIQGGIFGAAPAPVAGTYQSASVKSSVEGGIFGANTAVAPEGVASATTKSSVAGGIFGGPTAAAAPEFESQLTTSSVDGGIFGGDGSLARPDVEKPRLDPMEQPVAGNATGAGDAFAANVNVVSAAAPQPLSPLHSARANPNRSNVQGGVFSTANATPSKVGKARVDSIAQQSSFTLAHN